MAFRINGTPVVNPTLPPFEDLDSLPFSEFNLQDKFLLDRELKPLTRSNIIDAFNRWPFGSPILFVHTSRGCPHQCSYCNNCRYVSLYGKNRLRYQSVSRFMDEMEAHLNTFGFLDHIFIGDDDFLARPMSQLEEFAERYKKTVDLPFGIFFSATTFRKEKLQVLLDAGLKYIQMGVQSASQRVLTKVYNRKISIEKTQEVVQQIHSCRKNYDIYFLLDFIIDNPYETRDDIYQTFRFLMKLPPDIRLNFFLMVFFPGTPIYERALKDGIIDPYNPETFRNFGVWSQGDFRYQRNYETLLLLLTMKMQPLHGMALPMAVKESRRGRFALHVLGSWPLRKAASIVPEPLMAHMIKLLLRRVLPFVYRLRTIGEK